MNKELKFARTLEELRRQAREQNNVIAEEQVREAFTELELSQEQLELVFDYLKKHQIGIDAPVDSSQQLTQEDSDYLQLYLEELQALKQPDSGEQEAITLSAMAGDKQAKEKLIELYLPQVAEIAKLYAGQGVFLEDLIGEGNVALTMGTQMLGCLEQKEEVQGMLGRMIMDAMEELITQTRNNSKLDEQVASKVNEINDKAREMAEEMLRKVTVAELAKESGMSAEDIREVLRISAAAIEFIEPEDEKGGG